MVHICQGSDSNDFSFGYYVVQYYGEAKPLSFFIYWYNSVLQGGKLDHADRLFHSIESAWNNCLTNSSDVKELIPEFFYLPEFLVNSNEYYLGIKQDGETLADVVLPPWAKVGILNV